VKELLQGQVNKPLMLDNADTVKFLQLITPGVEPHVKMTWKQGDAGYHVVASLTTEAVHFKLNGNYITVD
jgi:predicted trehalose synthase